MLTTYHVLQNDLHYLWIIITIIIQMLLKYLFREQINTRLFREWIMDKNMFSTKSLLKDYFSLCTWIHVGVCMWVQVSSENQKVLGYPRTAVTDSCEQPDVGSEYWTLVLCKLLTAETSVPRGWKMTFGEERGFATTWSEDNMSRVTSLLSPHGSWKWNSGCQSWWQAHLPTDISARHRHFWIIKNKKKRGWSNECMQNS